MEYQIPTIEKTLGYRFDNLLLPKARINEQAIKNDLTLRSIRGGQKFEIWSETAHHIITPREYIPQNRYDTLDFEIVDLTSALTFPIAKPPVVNIHWRNDVQSAASAHMVKSGLLVLACGKGKTIVAIKSSVERHTPVIIVVHTTQLMDQWVNQLIRRTDLKKKDIGIIQEDRMEWDRPVVIAMLKTLALRSSELPMRVRMNYGVVIYDEVHHLAAPEYSLTADLFFGLRWGLTATPKRTDGMHPLFHYHIGPPLFINDEQELPISIRFLLIPTCMLDIPVRDDGLTNYPEVERLLTVDEVRNGTIAQEIYKAASTGRICMVLSNRTEHLRNIQRRLQDMGIDARVADGKVSNKEFRTSEIDQAHVFLTTPQIGREGLDRPDLSTIFVLLPFRDENAWKQLLGRAQRYSPNKPSPLCVVFEDYRIKPIKRGCTKSKEILAQYGYDFETKQPKL